MRILVTGARGFIGKNLIIRLREQDDVETLEFVRSTNIDLLPGLVEQVDVIIHLAGENRPKDVSEYERVNASLTNTLCESIRNVNRKIPLIITSSTQAVLGNPYGQSKRKAELVAEKLANETGNPVIIYRLPGVFGKWCKPNYNSVIATFCHNIANDLPIQINDPAAQIKVVHVDDVVSEFICALSCTNDGLTWGNVEPEYSITLSDLAEQIKAFSNCRNNLVIERVGSGLTRALYSTYISYLPPSQFVYDLPRYQDNRGIFVEMLKTHDSGQFSFFTANPGVTRGEHYHHSKTEKFLVIKGRAHFAFRHLVTGETCEIYSSGDKPQVVETIPGWVHNITNIGSDEMIVMLWANENFDREYPDTISCKV
jgi:UDP-2-acetamido-2,6-beta-L-arabino-hexul-4-ose reductase